MGEQGFTQNALVKAVGEAMTEQGRMAAEHRITTAGVKKRIERNWSRHDWVPTFRV